MNKSLTVIDSSTLIPGPFASFLLQKHINAKVIKLEDAHIGDKLSELKPTKNGVGLFYKAINEGKKIIKADFSENGTQVLERFIKGADVFITNFKSTRADKIGLSPKAVHALNPSIVYCSISGYPDKHPFAGFGAHDINVLALSGYLAQQMVQDGKINIPVVQLADLFTSYHAALRIMAKLLSGKGGVVQVSMFEATLEAFHLYRYPQTFIGRTIDEELTFQNQLPCYHLYKVRDGYVAVGAIETSFWTDLCHLLKRADLISRQFDANAINELEKEFAKKERTSFLTHDVCVTPILTTLEALKLKLAI